MRALAAERKPPPIVQAELVLPVWERSVYAPPAGNRLRAFVCTILLFAVVIAAMFVVISRSGVTSRPPSAPLVITMLPLASPPPAPHAKDKPEPRKKHERLRPEPPKPDLTPKPVIALPSPLATSPPVVTPPPPAPAPKPVDDAAPKTVTAPPAPQLASPARDSWQARVLARLGKYRRYPPGAQRRHEQGVPYIRFVMDREGKVISSRLERASGFPELDGEAIALPQRARPLPKPPEDVTGDTIELVVPVEFFIR
jgi:periplasmic protein TonB